MTEIIFSTIIITCAVLKFERGKKNGSSNNDQLQIFKYKIKYVYYRPLGNYSTYIFQEFANPSERRGCHFRL